MNPLTFISGFSLQTKALLVIGVFVFGFGSGYKVSGAFKKAGEGVAIKAQLKTSDTIAESTKETVKKAQVAVAETKIIYRTIKEKIHAENDTRICFADATALSLWNEDPHPHVF